LAHTPSRTPPKAGCISPRFLERVTLLADSRKICGEGKVRGGEEGEGEGGEGGEGGEREKREKREKRGEKGRKREKKGEEKKERREKEKPVSDLIVPVCPPNKEASKGGIMIRLILENLTKL
jgi:hypothetical protein